MCIVRAVFIVSGGATFHLIYLKEMLKYIRLEFLIRFKTDTRTRAKQYKIFAVLLLLCLSLSCGGCKRWKKIDRYDRHENKWTRELKSKREEKEKEEETLLMTIEKWVDFAIVRTSNVCSCKTTITIESTTTIDEWTTDRTNEKRKQNTFERKRE